MVFTGDACHFKRLLADLSEIERVDAPPWMASISEVSKQLKTLESTEYFRRNADPACFAAPAWGEYQTTDIKRAIRQSRFLFGWEMGLGKTYASITAINHYFKDNQIDHLMVLAPSSSIYNFRRELLKFGTFGLKEDEIYVADRLHREPFKQDYRVIFCTYKTWVLLCQRQYEAEHKGKSISSPRKPIFDLSTWGTHRAIIADEIQALRNPGSKQTKWTLLHSHFFRVRFGLSGTPAPNKIEQWYGPIKFLDATILPKTYQEWITTIAKIGTRFSRFAISSYYSTAVSAFSTHISGWVARRYKKDCAPDLPDLVNNSEYLPMTVKHAKLYHSFITYDLSKMVEQQNGALIPVEVKNRFPYLIQAVDNPCLLKGKIDASRNPALFKMVEDWKFEDHSQFDIMSDYLDRWVDEEEQKVIVWSGHPLTLDQLAESFKKYDPITIHGQNTVPKGMTEASYRDKMVELFKTDTKHKVLFASYLVLESAVNITEATRALFWDRSFDLEKTLQAMARNHRIGSTDPVIITSLVCDKTIACLVDFNVETKGALNNKFFNLDSLSQAEYKAIFEGNVPDRLK
jgi:SNF2 family DNA or RNA helicase